MPTAESIYDIVRINIENDIQDLEEYRAAYLQHASLSRDVGDTGASEAYLHAALELEACIQTLGTIPWQVGKDKAV